MRDFEWLEEWYLHNCDGEWEHNYGIDIQTLDNPGWRVRIDLKDTKFNNSREKALDRDMGNNDWIRCSIKDGVFDGCGDAKKIELIIRTFREWIDV